MMASIRLILLFSFAWVSVTSQVFRAEDLWKIISRPVFFRTPASVEGSDDTVPAIKNPRLEEMKKVDELYFEDTLPTWKSVCFITENTGWVAGDVSVRGSSFLYPGWCILLATTDGGTSWKTIKVMPRGFVNTVLFSDKMHGYVVGATDINDRTTGFVALTTDGGLTWPAKIYLSQYEFSSLHDVYFVNNLKGWIVGEAQIKGDVQGLILATQDGGKSWQEQYLNGRSDFLERVRFVDEKAGWVVGSNVILNTKDGGQTWQEQRYEAGSVCFDLTVIGSHELWVVGGSGALLHTINRGNKWEQVALPPDFQELWLSGLYFKDSRHGWIAGNGGVILGTEDGGRLWRVESTGKSSFLRKLTGIGNNVFAAGNDGIILKRKT
jgi:photosystem II stability/assembly factor-like uncharacterized protein